jgi:predicted kinase
MKSKLIIISGPPGSGKSTLAQRMITNDQADMYFEADMWMLNSMGDYSFDPKKLSYCHEKCFSYVENALKAGRRVIQSNTNLVKREVKKYIDLAKSLGAEIEIIHLEPRYKSIHNVPDEQVQKMIARRERYSLEDFS